MKINFIRSVTVEAWKYQWVNKFQENVENFSDEFYNPSGRYSRILRRTVSQSQEISILINKTNQGTPQSQTTIRKRQPNHRIGSRQEYLFPLGRSWQLEYQWRQCESTLPQWYRRDGPIKHRPAAKWDGHSHWESATSFQR